MRVFLLSPAITAATLARLAALQRDEAVSQAEILADIESLSQADIVIVEGTVSAERFMPDLKSAPGRVIVLADRSSTPQRDTLLHDGADLVLHGQVSDDEIVAQIRAIARRNLASARRITRPTRAKIVLERDRRYAVVLGRRVTLTLLEGNLLAAFTARPDQVLSGCELLTSAWGAPIAARSTLSASIRRLRIKIEPDPSNPVFIHTVWGGGYIYRPEGEDVTGKLQ